MDRATGFEPVGRGFDSLRAHQSFLIFSFPNPLSTSFSTVSDPFQKRVGGRPDEMMSGHMQRTRLACGVLLLTGSVIGLASVQYLMPPSFDNPPGVNQAGIVHFRSVISTAPVTPLGVSAFVVAVPIPARDGLWVGYGTILLTSYRYNAGIGRFTLPAIGRHCLVARVAVSSLAFVGRLRICRVGAGCGSFTAGVPTNGP